MNNLPKSLSKIFPQVVYLLAAIGFFILTVLFYAPKSLIELMSTGQGLFEISDMISFNMSICTAIISLVLVITRIAFYIVRRNVEISLGWYAVWCAAEVLLISFYMALYLTLMAKGGEGYFFFLGKTFKDLLSIFIFPYAIITMAYYLKDGKQEPRDEDGRRLRFYDSRNLLKFAVQASSVLYLESSENYVYINYLKEGQALEYKLRNSMRNIEEMCEKAGFVRSHRSYLINPEHVSLIRKDENGLYFAEFDSGKGKTVPVSRKYYDKVTAVL